MCHKQYLQVLRVWQVWQTVTKDRNVVVSLWGVVKQAWCRISWLRSCSIFNYDMTQLLEAKLWLMMEKTCWMWGNKTSTKGSEINPDCHRYQETQRNSLLISDTCKDKPRCEEIRGFITCSLSLYTTSTPSCLLCLQITTQHSFLRGDKEAVLCSFHGFMSACCEETASFTNYISQQRRQQKICMWMWDDSVCSFDVWGDVISSSGDKHMKVTEDDAKTDTTKQMIKQRVKALILKQIQPI